MERYVAAGLRVEEPEAALVERVRGHAREAGSLLRLSTADLDLLAAALRAGPGAVLVTDDYTIQDVARRLDIRVQSIVTPGIQATKDWKSRCAGCGRTYPADAAEHPCPVCGAQVRLKPASRASRP